MKTKWTKVHRKYLRDLEKFAKERKAYLKRTYHNKENKTKYTKPKEMWAYIELNGKSIHCDTSEKRLRGFWAEQGKTKRIRKVKVSLEKSK